jgi:DNA processing protein
MRARSTPAELVDQLRLSRAEGVGPIAYRRLLARYGSAKAALAALADLARAGGRTAPPNVPGEPDIVREIEAVEKLGGKFVTLGSAGYPCLLALLDDAPPVLAVLGAVEALSAPAVGIVGGRNASANGQRMAEQLAEELAATGLVVVSGLARGIDAAAHRGALRSGRTIAAVAGGIDQPYPAEHAALQRQVADCGAVVSEAPLGTVPQARHFPRRNRVIAGLSLGVVVIEAAPRSGSLITARLAQEAGRELFAVPGSPLDPRARGSNDLIRQGAHLTETAADVLDNLPDHPSREGLSRLPLFARRPGGEPPEAHYLSGWTEPPESESGIGAARSKVVELLETAPTAVDDLVRRCQFSSAAVMAALLELELAGRIETLPGARIALRPS